MNTDPTLTPEEEKRLRERFYELLGLRLSLQQRVAKELQRRAAARLAALRMSENVRK